MTKREEDAAVHPIVGGLSTHRRGRATDPRTKSSLTDRELAGRLKSPDILRPEMPIEWKGSPHAWLSNFDIDEAMYQYSRLVPDFEYLGTMPVDFAEHNRTGKRCVKMCSAKPAKRVYTNKQLGAVVVNLDVHTGKGTHWVALMLDCRDEAHPKLLYYDPTGRSPPRRWYQQKSAFSVLLAAMPLAERSKAVHTAMYNTTRHQRRNSECGIFSMMVVDAMIAHVAFSDYCRGAINDDYAFKHRSIFYEAPDGFVQKHIDPDAPARAPWTWQDLFRSGRAA